MTPVRPVGTSSSTLPRQPRPAAVRRSFAQLVEDENAVPAAASNVPSAPGYVGLLDTESADVASAPVYAGIVATRAFEDAGARAAGRHPGQFVDVVV